MSSDRKDLRARANQSAANPPLQQARQRPTPDNSRLQKLTHAAWLAPMSGKDGNTQDQPTEVPHYHGHRMRLRERFQNAGPDALSDYELLEMVLFTAQPRA